MRKFILGTILLSLLAVNGCTLTSEDYAKIQAEAQKAQQIADQADQAKVAIDEFIASLPDGEAKTKALEISAKAGEVSSKAKVALATFNEQLAVMENADVFDVVAAGVNSVGGVLPQPFGSILLMLTTVAAIGRGAYIKYVAKKAIKSVNPAVAAAIKANPSLAETIRADQGAAAAKLVDQAQGKATGLPI